MGKDLNKKFTVSLDISTKDAEKQVAASAENIKQILSSAIKDGVGVKELRNIAKSVNSIFEGIGQEAPIDIDKSFTGNGSVAKRVKMLTDALDNLSDVMDKIKSGSIDVPGGENFDGISKEVQEEIGKLKKQQQEIQEIVSAINNPQNVKVKLAKKSDDQVEQLKALKKEFVDASNAKTHFENNKMTGTNEYLAAVAKYVEAASKVKAAFESEALTDKGVNWILTSGTETLQDADNVLDKFLKQNTSVMDKVQNMYSEKFNSIGNQIELLAKPYDILKTKLEEYAKLQDTLENNDRLSDDEEDEIWEKVDALEKYFVSLDNVGNKKKEIKKILSDVTFGSLVGDDAIKELSNLLGVKIPEAAQRADEALKSIGKSNVAGNATSGLQNDISKIGSETQESIQETSVALDKIENKTQDVNATFKDLVDYISKSGSGHNPSTFFDKLESGAQQVDEELKNILQSLKLIDSSGNINLESIKSGFTNAGGFVSDKYTMIARPDWYLPKIQSLQPMLMEAQQAGAKIGAIFDIIEDKTNELIYEVQNTVAGTAAFSHHQKSVNKEALGATDGQIKDLVNTLQILQQKGLFVDWGGDNILYDKDQGFSIIDLGNKGGKSHTVSVQNTMQENLDRLVSEMFKFDKSVVQSSFVDNLYKMANDIGSNVVNPHSTASSQSTQQHKAVQTSIDKTTESVKAEEDAHEQNTAAINAENAALQAQIELKKKAQSMKWEAFALDESTVDLKKQAGFQTLSDMEKFWKKANYEKQIDWHEISKSQALDIFKKKLPYGLTSAWYGSQSFKVKDKLENEILADDEVRNAALSYLYHLYNNQMSFSEKNPNVKTFEDFLNTEFEVFRGDDAPLIYGDESKLSFSFHTSTANGFDPGVGTAKIKPKDTIGNAGSTFESEIETFVDSSKTSWFKQTGETFAEFYNKQTKEMQDEINAGLVNLEKQRISDILGDDFTKLAHQAGKTPEFQYGILQKFQQGIVPEKLDVYGVENSYDEFADAYNGLSDMGKKFAAYYASMDAVSASLPKQFSISSYGKESSKNQVGKDAKLFNAVLNDPSGVKKHVASLTGELGFNLFDKSPEEIKAETDAIEQHTKAIQNNAKAQQNLNTVKADYDSAEKYLFNATENAADMNQYKALSNLYSNLDLVHYTETQQANEISKGHFVDNNTGEVFDISDIFDEIENIEKLYGNNLDCVKDYLNQLYGKLSVSSQTPNDVGVDDDLLLDDDDLLLDGIDLDEVAKIINGYKTVEDKLYEAKNAAESFDKLAELSNIQNKLSAIQYDVENDPDIINKGKFLDTSTMEETDWREISNLVSEFEAKYNDKLDYVHNYLKGVFSKIPDGISEIFVELDDDDLDVGAVDDSKQTANDFNSIYWKLEAINDGNQEKCEAISKIQAKISDISYDTINNLDLIDQGKFIDGSEFGITDWTEVSDLVSDFESKYGENLDYIHDYLKQVFAKQVGDIDKFLNGDDVSFKSTDNLPIDDAIVGNQVAVVKSENVLQEADAFDDLSIKVHEVRQAIEAKTQAFIDEGNAVDQVVQQEIDYLNKLKALLDEIQNVLQIVFAANGKDFGNIDLGQDKINGGTASNVLQNIQQLLGQILSVLQGFTGVESDNKNSVKYKEPSVNNNVDTEEFANKLPENIATEDTLQAIRGTAEEIAGLLKTQDVAPENVDSIQKSLNTLISALSANVKGLVDVANGIVDHQEAQKMDTNAAMAKIADPTQHKQITDIATNSVGSLGSEVQIKNLKALADGIVRVEGAYKNAEGAWEGFTVSINESNQAVDLAINKQSAFAKALNEASSSAKDASKPKQDDAAKELAKQIKDSASKESKKLKGSFNTLDFKIDTKDLSDEQQKIADEYKDLSDILESYSEKSSQISKQELDNTLQRIAALQQEIKAYKDKYSIDNGFGGKKNAYGKTVAVNATAKYNAISGRAQQYIDAGSTVVSSAMTEYMQAYQRLIAMQSQFKSGQQLTPDQESAFIELKNQCNDYYKALQKVIDSSDKLTANASHIMPVMDDISLDTFNDRAQALKAYIEDTYGASTAIGKLNGDATALTFTIKNGDGTITNMTASLNAARTAIVSTAGSTEKATSKFGAFFDAVKAKSKELWVYAASRFGVDEIIQQVRNGINYVREIDSALTELKKVTNETDATYKNFLQTASKTADVIGSNVADFTNATADFARLGYNINEATELAKTASVYKNVGDGISDISQASESIISTMKAFGIEANNAMGIVDRFNEVGNNFAISSTGIGEAMQRSASALFEAGNSIDESIALITAANSVIQNPEQVGTALKTLALRLRGAKVELEEAGEDVDGMAESTSQLQAKLLALTHGKVDIMLDADTFKNTTQILREMSAAWEDMTDIERASALELMGGKRQANILSSVIKNFDTVEDVIKTSSGSSGSALAENEKYLDSVQGKIDKFNNALQTMWNNMLNSEVIKGFIGFGTDVIKFLDTGIGKITALVAAFKLMGKFKGFSFVGIAKGLGDTIKNITQAQQTLKTLSSISTVSGPLPTESINAYAQAVAGLTAKQQANLLASQNLTKQDIQQVLQTNKCTEAEIREAMAHVHTKATKEQEAAASQALFVAKTQEMAATYKNNAATLQGAAADEALAAATILETAASNNASKADLLEMINQSNLTVATKQQIIAELGLTAAKKTGEAANYSLLASIEALYASNPIGWIMMIISAIIMVIQWVVSASKTVSRSAEEIEQSLQSTVNECKNIANEFKQIKESADDVIDRFVELSSGVDGFGKNISLTDEEYEEFLDLNNKIAEMFPDINMGFDENGNAMLALAGTADTLANSLWELVKAEREAANVEIAKQLPSALSDLQELEDIYNSNSEYYGKLIDFLKEGKVKQHRSGENKKYYKAIEELLSDYDIEYDTKVTTRNRKWNSKTISWDPNNQVILNIIAGYEKLIANSKAELESQYKSLNSMVSSWMSTEFDYQQLDTEIQRVANLMVNSLDFKELGLNTEEEVHNYIRNNILEPIKNLSPEFKNAFSELLNISSDNKTASKYIEELDNKIREVAKSSDGLLSFNRIMEMTGYNDIVNNLSDAAKEITSVLVKETGENYYDLYHKLLKNLSPDELLKAFDIVKKYGIKTWDELQEALESKTFDVVLNYDKEKEGMEKLLAAIDESISATGLSDESISNLQSRYQDLENYDPSRLFEKTANGIHLNIQALRELEDEYQKSYKEDLKEQLKGQIKQYQNLTKKIDECSDARERAELYSQRQAVLDQIKDTAELASQYDGLTSAYYKWQKAQANGNERDIYEDIISGRESMDELMSRGWIDDEVRAYIDLLSGKDLSTAPYEEVLAAYKELNKEIGNSGHSIYDFFTKDEDGNSTTEGIFNFFDAVRSVMGETYAWIDENGKYNFDFGIGGDQDVADKFGMDIEAVQAILRAASDAGFVVNIDSVYSLVDGLQESTFSAEEATKKLKELGLISSDISFNFETEDADDLNKQIEAAQSAVETLMGEDTVLNLELDGAAEAQTTLAILLQQKHKLSEPAWINLDYSKVDETSVAADKAMLAFKNFYEAYNNHEINVKCGVDTKTLEASEKEVQKYLDEIKSLVANDPNLKAQIESTLNITLDTVTPEAFAAALANAPEEEMIKLLPDGSKVEGYEVDEKTGEVFYNVGTDPTNPNDVNNWTPPTKYGTVVYTASTVAGKIFDKIFGGGSADGTAHSSGTAYAGGSWGASKTETSLVGELGPEILVRNGRWTTVGEDGAEFTQVKKGDIIFNHKQTESLLKHGYVTGRGKAHASGTAFSDGSGPERFTVTSAHVDGGGKTRLQEDAKSAADEFREVFDWIAVRIEEISDDIDKKSAQLENNIGYKNQNKTVDEIIDLNQRLHDNLIVGSEKYYAYAQKLLNKVPKEYRTAAQDGTIAIETFVGEADEKAIEAIKEYREWVQKGDDAAQQAEETLTEISNLAKQAIDNIATQFDNEASLRNNKSDQLDAYNELLENQYGVGSEEIYRQLIAENNTDIKEFEKQKSAMQAELNKRVESGEIDRYSQDWYDAVNDIAAVDTEIINLKNDNEDLKNSMSEIHWYHSDLLVSQFEAVSEEAENLIDILSTKDAVDEMGNWTDEGITMLGLYAQQMEVAQKQAAHYAEEIQYLKEHKDELGYTDEEYLDKLDELKSGQYDAIKSYNDSKDAIVDLNKERVDAIKNGIEEEIEAYEKLIDAKKEELDAEKDLHNFQKGIMDQQKDIADIERQLAALSADNSASARAKRAQLEAELSEAKAELEETYYDRSVSNQQDALDKELESFQEEKDAEIEGWEKYLEDTETVVSDSLAIVQTNTDTVYQTLDSLGYKYSLSITDYLKSPWENGSSAIDAYQEKFGEAVSETMGLLDELSDKYNASSGDLASEVKNQGQKHINDVDANMSEYSSAYDLVEFADRIKNHILKKDIIPENELSTYDLNGDGRITITDYAQAKKRIIDSGLNTNTSTNTSANNTVVNEPPKNGDKITVKKNATHYSAKSGNKKMASFVPGGSYEVYNTYGSGDSMQVLIGRNGAYTGWIKLKDIEGYAKGSSGIKEDQLALIDELGEELQFVPGKNGRLEYVKKGTGIVPADLTERIINLAMNPQEMLDRNRPQIAPSKSVINTEISIDCSVGTMVNIEHCDQNTLPDVEKIVNKAFDKHMQTLNNSIKRFAR